MLKEIYHYIISLHERYVEYCTRKAELCDIEKKRNLYETVQISEQEDKDIRSYWKEISGQTIDTRWHRLYASYLQCPIRKDFFPAILYSTKLEKRLQDSKFEGVLSDKGFMTTIFPGDSSYRTPKTVVYNSYGTFTNGDRQVINEDDAAKAVAEAGMVIVKPTIDTCSGDGILKVDFTQGGGKTEPYLTVSDLFKRYKQNFIVQECVRQSHYLSRLCDKSLNTFRITTYICQGKVFHTPLFLRMGTGTYYVDNIHHGGIGVGISENYKLRRFAFSEFGERYESHPYSHVKFEGYDVSPLKNIVEVAERLHGYVPMLKMISWDWSLDENDMPVLIELNIKYQTVWTTQMFNGESFFGENTAYFANLIKNE